MADRLPPAAFDVAKDPEAFPGGDKNVTKELVYHEVENTKFSWFHVKAILIAGVGFFCDAYDLFVIGIVKPMIAIVYYPQYNGKLRVSDDLWLSGVALAGTLLGQVFFGLMGDYLGRKKIYLITLFLIIGCTIGQCLSASTVKGVGFMAVICFWRFCLGIGIGGDYPLSATIVAEYSNKAWRGAFVASVFAMQGFGIIFGSLMGVIVTACFQDKIKNHDILYLDIVWRIIIGLGCIPAVATIYLRSKLPETPRFVTEVEQDVDRAAKNMQAVRQNAAVFDSSAADEHSFNRISWKRLHRYLTYPSILRNRNFWVLIGTCSCWFLLDIAYYSQNLFLPNVLTDINYNPSITLPASKIDKKLHNYPLDVIQGKNQTSFGFSSAVGTVYAYNTPPCVGVCAEQVYHKVFKTAAGNAIVGMMGTVPGYWFTVAFVDRMGRVPIQFMGFILMTLLLICLAAAYNQIVDASKWLFIVMYALTFFFANFGPNATTFILPSELFNTKYRSSLHGISAASGKAGAVVGTFALGKAFTEKKISLPKVLAILATVNAIGTICTIFVPETKRMFLEDSARSNNSVWANFLRRCGIEQVNPADEEDETKRQPSAYPLRNASVE